MWKLVKIMAALYIGVCLILFFIQDRFIFNPYPVEENYQYRTGVELEIPLDDEHTMNTLFVEQSEADKPKGALLYLHGNRGNIRFGIYQVRHMMDLGYDIFIPDYRSYGKTEGKICCEKQMYNDVQKVYDYIKSRYEEDKIILVGYSLGTGMASYLASVNNPSQMFLVAPFTSITDIKNKYLWFLPDFILRFKFPVKRFLKSVECPVTIVHGTEDEIVDYNYSAKLNSMYADKVDLITAHQESHRSIIFAEALKKVLYQKLYAIQ